MEEQREKTNKNKLKSDMEIPQRTVDLTALIILCLMALQPLKGIFVKFEVPADIYDNFFLKSNLIRGLGLIALIAGLLFIILREKVSLPGTLKDIFYRKPWNLCFTLMLLWTFVSYAFSKGQYISMYGDALRYEGMIAYFAYAGFFGLASLLKNGKYKRFWMDFMIGVSTILGICSLISFYGGNQFLLTYMNDKTHGTTGLAGTFLQYNHYAYYLSIMILLIAGLFLTEKNTAKKIIYGVLLGFHQYILSVNGTRGGYVAVLTGLIALTVFILKRKDCNRKTALLMWCICILFSVVESSFWTNVWSIFTDASHVIKGVNADDAGSGRWRLWKRAIEITSEHPITGCGPNMAYYYMSSKGLPDMPHNEYLQYFCDFGIPGGALYLGGLILLLVDRIKNIKNLSVITLISGMAAVAYAVSAFFGVTSPLVLPFFFILLAFAKGSEERQKK